MHPVTQRSATADYYWTQPSIWGLLRKDWYPTEWFDMGYFRGLKMALRYLDRDICTRCGKSGYGTPISEVGLCPMCERDDLREEIARLKGRED